MNGLFNPDSGLMRALSRLFDLLVLNRLATLLCVPVITAGASLTALHSVIIQMVEEREGYIIKTFFRKFKENFKPATISWLIMLAFSFIIFVDFRVVLVMGDRTAQVMQTVLMVLSAMVIAMFQYVFPLTARYENSIRGYWETAVKLAVGFLPKTIVMLVINAAVVMLGYKYMLYILPLLVMYGLSGPAYLCGVIYMTIFHKIEPEKKEEEPGELFRDDDAEEENGGTPG